MRYRSLFKGLSTYVPGIKRFKLERSPGAFSARYCYSVWLRHLVIARNSGLDVYPKIVAELGPGNSLGVGLAALISGCDKYYGFDVVELANAVHNVQVFDDLVSLFKNRASVPGDDEFPNVKPYLENYDFPEDIFVEERLRQALEESRLDRIRNSITDFQHRDSPIQYKVPWHDAGVLEAESVDMIYSQAVLEHVDDLVNTYRSMRRWLRSNGYISHQIDFKSHGTAGEWNGHWKYADFSWKLIRGKRPYLLNREPYSTHLAILKEQGFNIVCEKRIRSESRLTINDLAPRFRTISADDLTTSGAFIQAIKIA